MVISRITDSELAWKPVSYLSRVTEESKAVEAEQLHRVRLSVVGFKFPQVTAAALKDCIRICDSKTGKSRPAEARSAPKKGEVLVFSLPLYVKDFSNLHSNRVSIVHVVDSATEGGAGFFPGLSVADLLKSEQAREQAAQALSQLIKFNVHLEAALSVNPDGHMLITGDTTQLKAY